MTNILPLLICIVLIQLVCFPTQMKLLSSHTNAVTSTSFKVLKGIHYSILEHPRGKITNSGNIVAEKQRPYITMREGRFYSSSVTVNTQHIQKVFRLS